MSGHINLVMVGPIVKIAGYVIHDQVVEDLVLTFYMLILVCLQEGQMAHTAPAHAK